MGKSLYDYCMETGKDWLLRQWDAENGTMHPNNVTSGSHKKLWWRCEQGHRWQAAVYSRTGGGSGCPYCTGKKLSSAGGSLADQYPELVKEWHIQKNTGITPYDVPPGTHRKVWWRCALGHEWQAQINSRTSGAGCPICTNRITVPGKNDLATTHPDLAAQWYQEKNGTLTPDRVIAGSTRKVWWICSSSHIWRAAVSSRTLNRSGCPVCGGKKVIPGENDFAAAYPELASQWHPTKNGSLTPQAVAPFSNRKVWWICGKGHEFAAVIGARVSGSTACPYCTGRKVLSGFNDLETLHPAIAAQWHPDLNGTLSPKKVTTGSHKKVWWQCAEGHVWKAVIYSRTGSRKTGCPVCAGKVRMK